MGTKSFVRSSATSAVQYNSLLAGNTGFNTTLSVEYLIIGGGGGGGNNQYSSGGGAGGYLNSYLSELSGANSSSLNAVTVTLGRQYSVQIGAGGAASSVGNNSFFDTLIAFGGGPGTNFAGTPGDGGSGGGANSAPEPFGAGGGNASTRPGFGRPSQGMAGGIVTQVQFGNNRFLSSGGGGGGAGQEGGIGNYGRPTNSNDSNIGAAGGFGLSSSITGSSVGRAGGGAGGAFFWSPNHSNSFGGGNGGTFNPGNSPVAGTVNTGGGGGGAHQSGVGGGAGGSGIVILRYPNTFAITLGAGLTGSSSVVGGDRVTQITAGAGSITWGMA